MALVLSVAILGVGSALPADLDPGPVAVPPPDLVPPPDFARGLVNRVCERETIVVEVYPPAPRYLYDNRRGATWTGNGWVYLPVGESPPDDNAPRLVAPPPPHGFNPAEFLEIPCRVLRHLPEYLPAR